MNTKVLLVAAWITILVGTASAQSFEITPFVGGQTNGGLDLSTTRFRRIEVGNGLSYGVSAGYLLGDHYGLEFMWNHNESDTVAEPLGGGNDVKVFGLSTNQYLGNFIFHVTDRESAMRPFVLIGLGATHLSTDRSVVSSTTRFAAALGGGVKFNFSRHFGARAQAKWSPTYITTTNNGGYWCDPFWGGCWLVGNDHYLHEFDLNAGLTFRF